MSSLFRLKFRTDPTVPTLGIVIRIYTITSIEFLQYYFSLEYLQYTCYYFSFDFYNIYLCIIIRVSTSRLFDFASSKSIFVGRFFIFIYSSRHVLQHHFEPFFRMPKHRQY